MQIGLGTASVTARNIYEQIAWIRDAGFAEVELSCCPNPTFARGLWARELSPTSIDALRAALTGFATVDLHAPFQNVFDVTLVSPNPLLRALSIEEITHAMRLAADIGGDVVTFHTGRPCSGVTPEEHRCYLIDSLRRLNEAARKCGVRLGAEVADYFMPADRYELLEELALERIGITLDVGHIARESPDGPMYRAYGTIGGFVRRFAPLIWHVHLHDYDSERDHLQLGAGQLDLPDVLRALYDVEYAGNLSFEFNPALVEPSQMLESKAHLEQLLQRLGPSPHPL